MGTVLTLYVRTLLTAVGSTLPIQRLPRIRYIDGKEKTGRSESINAFLKQYVTQKNGLYGFMFRFKQGIRTQKYRQLKAVQDTSKGRPKLMTDLAMDRQMSQIYTKKMF